MKKEYRNALLITIILFVAPLFASYTVSAYPDGAVIIHEDGSVTGTDKILQNGDVYTLTGDISITGEYKYAGIQVLKDGVTIDGAQFSITTDGSGWYGLDLSERNNLTIKNLRIIEFKIGINLRGLNNNITNNTITSFSGNISGAFSMGIWVFGSKNSTITSNTITKSQQYGILVEAASSNNLIMNNILSENNVGIDLSFNGNNTLRNNQMNNNQRSFQLAYNTYDQFLQDIDQSNTIDGKPIIYWVNEHDKTVPTNAGFVALGNCTNITSRNLQISNTYDSINLANTDDSVIDNNIIEQCGTGIFLKFCHNISVTHNSIRLNTGLGIGTIKSENILIAENDIDQCFYGISTAGQTDQHVGGYGSTKMTITRNTITNCTPGIYFSLSSNNIISNNRFEGNVKGINLIASSQNVFVENTFTANTEGAFRVADAVNNSIYHNNFIENSPEGSQIVTGNSRGNMWDNGIEGNYWSNYQTNYSNASMVVGKGIWNTQYQINPDNIDHYPLVAPFEGKITVPEPIPEPTTKPTLTPEATRSAKTENGQETTPLWIIMTSAAVIVLSVGACAIYFLKRPK